ncbi:protein NUCLEAR FUSION DEFECTIVE 6, chloroplastic/mitochondrial [Pistacia vera]|uniref:protein NUCLEAR FUSION DEFECTIVE 6, chloroplastic/mitochondrial n=1 Tax=Pistacia vera TaxID=55513 RepID=UPI001262B9D5|nr:protein NUCLEAR FUSION DEFECTIVE 6, chloroplastic/mitochondrial [Pistacia vera]
MASLCRSAIATASKSVAARSKSTTQKALNPKSIFSAFSSPTSSLPRASRVVSVLGSVDSLMPLHSAIASARLKSSIAVDSTCWSWLSQGLAVPL